MHPEWRAGRGADAGLFGGFPRISRGTQVLVVGRAGPVGFRHPAEQGSGPSASFWTRVPGWALVWLLRWHRRCGEELGHRQTSPRHIRRAPHSRWAGALVRMGPPRVIGSRPSALPHKDQLGAMVPEKGRGPQCSGQRPPRPVQTALGLGSSPSDSVVLSWCGQACHFTVTSLGGGSSAGAPLCGQRCCVAPSDSRRQRPRHPVFVRRARG